MTQVIVEIDSSLELEVFKVLYTTMEQQKMHIRILDDCVYAINEFQADALKQAGIQFKVLKTV